MEMDVVFRFRFADFLSLVGGMFETNEALDNIVANLNL